MSPLTTGCRQHQHQKQLLFLLLPPPVDIGFKSFRCHHHCPTMLPVPLPLDYFIVCARRHHRLIVASEQNFCCLSQYLQTSERKISALLSASVFNYFIITPNLDILLWQVLHHTKDYTGNPRLVRYQKTFPSYATPHTRSRQNDNYRHCPPEHWGHQHRTNWHKADRLNVFLISQERDATAPIIPTPAATAIKIWQLPPLPPQYRDVTTTNKLAQSQPSERSVWLRPESTKLVAHYWGWQKMKLA